MDKQKKLVAYFLKRKGRAVCPSFFILRFFGVKIESFPRLCYNDGRNVQRRETS